MLQPSLVMLSVGHSLSVLLVADVEAWPGMIAVIPAPGGLRPALGYMASKKKCK